MKNKQDLTAPETLPAPSAVLHTSELLHWTGLLCEQRYHPAGEYVFPAFSAHLICLYQGTPSLLEQVRNGHIHNSMVPHAGIQIVPAGTESTWRHRAGADNLHLHLSAELIHQVAIDLNRNRIELLNHFSLQDPRIEHICLALLAELREGGPSGRLYSEGLAIALAAHVISSYSSEPRPLPEHRKGLPPHLLRHVISVIEDRLSEDLGLVDLASEVGLSQSHFASLFRQSTGLSPHHYLVQRRLERAQSLLRSTNLAIDEIALMVGFYDQSHLTRHMRRLLGFTPKYVREYLS
ncbi:MAG TPA: AraC family transcriptional regulator [Ktedonobacteraceae bacterium]|nr:AraC family transcriptional regulator [Ktedonobacteraceae bacterium]